MTLGRTREGIAQKRPVLFSLFTYKPLAFVHLRSDPVLIIWRPDETHLQTKTWILSSRCLIPVPDFIRCLLVALCDTITRHIQCDNEGSITMCKLIFYQTIGKNLKSVVFTAFTVPSVIKVTFTLFWGLAYFCCGIMVKVLVWLIGPDQTRALKVT